MPRLMTTVVVALAATTCAPAALELQERAALPMNPHIHLYRFIRDGNAIALARIVGVQTRPGPGPGEETVAVNIEITEPLAGREEGKSRSYQFQRPQSPTAQLKFPDPLWGRVTVREGVRLLIVSNASALVYVDQISDPEDPVLTSIRSVIETERSVRDRAALLQKRFAQLRGGTVEQLFAGEAVASDGPFRTEDEAPIAAALSRAFADAKDEYVKMSLGTWLWESVYPRTDRVGRAHTLNITIQAAASGSESTRTFALDRLTDADPKTVHETGVKAPPAVLALLESRRRQESDAVVRHHIEEIIAALR